MNSLTEKMPLQTQKCYNPIRNKMLHNTYNVPPGGARHFSGYLDVPEIYPLISTQFKGKFQPNRLKAWWTASTPALRAWQKMHLENAFFGLILRN